jgi:xylulokinase
VNQRDKNIAMAAIDIGTSQIKLGVFTPRYSPDISALASIKNKIQYGAKGCATSSYKRTRDASFSLFKLLGRFLKDHPVDELYLGLSSHVSSLLAWNRESGMPFADDFPIWMDSTCGSALDRFSQVIGDGKAIVGSYLPPGNNWLLTKLLDRSDRADRGKELFLQAGDALFYKLSGVFASHYSSQISMIHHGRKDYVDELLSQTGIMREQMPEISTVAQPVLDEMSGRFGWPAKSFVLPSMADFYASFRGLRLNPGEGFMLGSTSEHVGIFTTEETTVSAKFVSFPFTGGTLHYGSTSTGANTVSWFARNILGKNLTTHMINDLTRKAASIAPEEVPVFLPYIAGERAPFWDHDLRASFMGLQLHHTVPHLFRAILEGVAFARRQCFEHLGTGLERSVKMGGGSSRNRLWNGIRASVLNRELVLAGENDMAISGLIDHLGDELSLDRSERNFFTVLPDPGQVQVYDKKYREFLGYQRMLW